MPANSKVKKGKGEVSAEKEVHVVHTTPKKAAPVAEKKPESAEKRPDSAEKKPKGSKPPPKSVSVDEIGFQVLCSMLRDHNVNGADSAGHSVPSPGGKKSKQEQRKKRLQLQEENEKRRSEMAAMAKRQREEQQMMNRMQLQRLLQLLQMGGEYLQAPKTEKQLETHQSARFKVGVASMQGWRRSMEDAHVTQLSLSEKADDPNACALFGVFDGHAGAKVAEFCGSTIHTRLMAEPAFSEKDYPKALTSTFMGLDRELLADKSILGEEESGCTAVCTLITPDGKLYCANAGDSRAILARRGEAIALSQDHKPTTPSEQARIEAAGGTVENGRVNSVLALSRGIGDFQFKRNADLSAELQAVTANPDIVTVTLEDGDEFVVVACDGIWDVKDNTQVMEFVGVRIAEGKPLDTIAAELCDDCLSTTPGSLGCDNMTVVIVQLLQKYPKGDS